MPNINDIEYFWQANPCGLPKTYYSHDKRAIFQETEKERYLKQSKILSYADFQAYRGKRVLEVGCGIGIDGIQFARQGAFYTGTDLSEAAVEITKERFSLFGQSGEIIRLNAESFPFPDDYFDHVYSFGVIHHTLHPEKIVGEIYRVLKPGGSINIMLYNRASFYYLIEIRFIRKIFFNFCDKKDFCKGLFLLFNKKLYNRFESFRIKLERIKRINRLPTLQEWISMNTDDVFCPLARVYSRKEAKLLFNAFRDFKTETWFIDKDNWFLWLVFGHFIPRQLENWLESNFGWFRMVEAKK